MSETIKLCASCEPTSNHMAFQTTVDTDDTKLPRWLRKCNYVQQFIRNYTCFRQNHPPHADSRFTIPVSPELAGRSILFWGAHEQNGLNIPGAREAYGDFSNSGVSYVKDDGSVTIALKCPSIYSAIPYQKQKAIVYPRHCHWVVSNKDKTKWLEPVYTTNVLCEVNKSRVKRALLTKNAFVVNALSYETHMTYNIPGTCSMGHQRIATLTSSQICSEVQRKATKQTPALLKKMGQVSNIPIILYCANSQCMAAKRLASHLLNAGFTNLYYYKEGVKGWHNLS